MEERGRRRREVGGVLVKEEEVEGMREVDARGVVACDPEPDPEAEVEERGREKGGRTPTVVLDGELAVDDWGEAVLAVLVDGEEGTSRMVWLKEN